MYSDYTQNFKDQEETEKLKIATHLMAAMITNGGGGERHLDYSHFDLGPEQTRLIAEMSMSLADALYEVYQKRSGRERIREGV